MRHVAHLRIGPIGFRVGSDWREPIAALESLYSFYPQPDDCIADFNVRLFAARPWRRFVRPSVMIGGDFTIPDAAPLPLAQGLLAAEMGMNLQMALAQRRYLLLHASVVERDGRALVMTGASGAGKSTLAAMLMARGWRLMGDEFALLDCDTGLLWPFPRLVSLKNGSIAEVRRALPAARFGPLLTATPKGDIQHLVPDDRSIDAMMEPAAPALLLFPGFGHATEVRMVEPSEAFVRLTQASTNYVAMGGTGFEALTGMVRAIPARAIDYPDTEAAIGLVDRLWSELP